MFAFDWEKGGPWDPKGVQGVVRWLHDVWEMVNAGPQAGSGDPAAERDAQRRVHQTIERVSSGLEKFSFNTSIAALMELKNALRPAAREGLIGHDTWHEAMRAMLLLMAPFTPHIAEELWARLGLPYSIHQQPWPDYDAAKAAEDEVTLVVQINGKVRERIAVAASISEAEAQQTALASDAVRRALDGGTPRKVIFVAGRAAPGRPAEPKVNIVI
jgi:leucyl-tRNA synthetase